jgi:ADP-glucose pyrophosphorylase
LGNNNIKIQEKNIKTNNISFIPNKLSNLCITNGSLIANRCISYKYTVPASIIGGLLSIIGK